MELSEGKLFTIEALNRIEGFEWPEGADRARMDGVLSDKVIHFLCGDKYIKSVNYYIANPNGLGIDTGITSAEFESVDGWVRNDGKSIHEISGKAVIEYIKRNDSVYLEQAEFVDLTHTGRGGDIMKWRYHKKQNQVEQPTPQPSTGIEKLISQHKAAKQSTLEARRLLEHAEAIEHNLLLSIEAWAESNGFYIGQLDKVQEVPELVVTDWLDLQKGDVVRWNVPGGSCDFTIDEIFRDSSGGDPCVSIISSSGSKFTAYPDEIKFIRRPAKGEK